MYALMQSCIKQLKSERPPREDEQYYLISSIALDIMGKNAEGVEEASRAIVAAIINAQGDAGRYQAFPYLYRSINQYNAIGTKQLPASGVYSVYYDALQARRRAGCSLPTEDLNGVDASVRSEIEKMPIDTFVDEATRSGICVEGSLLMTAADYAAGTNMERGCKRLSRYVERLRKHEYIPLSRIDYEHIWKQCEEASGEQYRA
jgi:hypothetical protein